MKGACSACLLLIVTAAIPAYADSTQCTIQPGMPANPITQSHQTLPSDGNPELTVQSRSGNIQVATWDRKEIQLDVLKEAPTKERADAVKLVVAPSGSGISIHPEFPLNHGWFGITTLDESYVHGPQAVKVHLVLTVPSGTRLNAAYTTCGNIDLTGLSGKISAHPEIGAIAAKKLTGSARLTTENGRITAEFAAVSGTVVLRSSNGAVEAWLPADLNGSMLLTAFHGNLTNDFGGTIITKPGGARVIRTTVGSGGAEVFITAVLGPLTVHRVGPQKVAPPARKPTAHH